jgi:hypothetical protein
MKNKLQMLFKHTTDEKRRKDKLKNAQTLKKINVTTTLKTPKFERSERIRDPVTATGHDTVLDVNALRQGRNYDDSSRSYDRRSRYGDNRRGRGRGRGGRGGYQNMGNRRDDKRGNVYSKFNRGGSGYQKERYFAPFKCNFKLTNGRVCGIFGHASRQHVYLNENRSNWVRQFKDRINDFNLDPTSGRFTKKPTAPDYVVQHVQQIDHRDQQYQQQPYTPTHAPTNRPQQNNPTNPHNTHGNLGTADYAVNNLLQTGATASTIIMNTPLQGLHDTTKMHLLNTLKTESVAKRAARQTSTYGTGGSHAPPTIQKPF